MQLCGHTLCKRAIRNTFQNPELFVRDVCLTAGSTVVQGLSLRVTMQFLFILINIISVHATPEEDADVRDTTPYGADAQTLLAAVGAAAALCQIVQVVAHRCVKLEGHRSFCKRVLLGT